ncbi:MAG: tRNA 2-thiouridine(34) synthase MnmA [bacterium]
MSSVNKKKKVFVALSGGVDSSVSLYLLKKAGFDVMAVFIKIGECAPEAGNHLRAEDCWIGERREAMRAAAYLNVPFLTFDFDKEYKKEVLDYFFREYKAGRTPNPDVMCNRKIKFPLFWKKAKALGADFMATGHYARIASGDAGNPKSEARNPKLLSLHSRHSAVSSWLNDESGNPDFKLLAGVDKEKDQSYFLYNLKRKDLEHILFPIGNFKKTEVRKIAKEAGLPTAEKKDSQGLCFLGQVNVRDFLKTKIKTKKGKIVDSSGKVLGEHDGLYYYTIGQRHGIGVSGGSERYFVVEKNIKKNELVVAPERDEKKFHKKWLAVGDLNLISNKIKFPINCSARIRYRAPLEKCIITPPTPSYLKRGGKTNIPRAKSRGFIVKFFKPQRAIAPGQSIVFYKGEEVLGGGTIK